MMNQSTTEVFQSKSIHSPYADASSEVRFEVSPAFARAFVALVEGLATGGSGVLIAYLYIDSWVEIRASYLIVLAAMAVAVPVVFRLFGLYSVFALRSALGVWSKVLGGWSLVFGTLLAALFFAKVGSDFSRVWAAAWFLGGLAAITLFRCAVSATLRRWNQLGMLKRSAVIVGGGPAADSLIGELESDPNSEIELIGTFDDRAPERTPTIGGYPRRGNLDDLIRFARAKRVDYVIVCLPLSAENRLLEVMNQLCVLPVHVRISANTSRLRFRPKTYSYVGVAPMLDLLDQPISDWGRLAKAIEDRVLALIMLALAAPIMMLIALALKLDSPGPVIFTQERIGFNNKPIRVHKFRSLYVHLADEGARTLVTRNDSRVTRVGRFIRRTSLDELPQLFNVLKGDLSLVGPRPHAPHARAADCEYADLVDGYFARHRVKPGMTGWAQVNGWRGGTDTAEQILRRVECDMYYIERWSIPLDLYILIRTPFELLRRGSY